MAKKTTLADIANILKSKKTKGDTSFWGVVNSVITDSQGNTTGYNVSLDGTATGTVKCNKVVGAEVGDQVLVTLRTNGEAVVIATKGGDADVKTVADDLAENYSTTEEVEEMIATMPSGTKIYYQASAPTGGTYKVGDTWFETDNGYKMYEWNGSQWVACQFGTSAIAAGSITAAKIAANTITASEIAAGSITGDRININSAIYSGSHSQIFDGNVGSYLGADGISYVGTYSGEKRRVLISKHTSESDELLSINSWDWENYYWDDPFFYIDYDGVVHCTALYINGEEVTPGGGGTPSAYIKSITSSANTLTWTNKDNTTASYTPTCIKSATYPSSTTGVRTLTLTPSSGTAISCAIPTKYVKSASVSSGKLLITDQSGTTTTYNPTFTPSTSGISCTTLSASGTVTLTGLGNVNTTSTDSTTYRVVRARDSDGTLFRYGTSSSRRYKKDITTEISDDLNPRHLYDMPMFQYKYKDENITEDDSRRGKDIYGIIVEELEKVYPIAVDYNEEGQPEAWNQFILMPALLGLIQDQHKEIELLKERISQ